MKVFKNVFTALMLALTAACASMPAPQSLDQKIAYSQATLTGVINAGATATEAGSLKVSDAIWLKSQTDRAGAMIAAARTFARLQRPGEAATQLEQARDLLIELNKFLTTKQGAP